MTNKTVRSLDDGNYEIATPVSATTEKRTKARVERDIKLRKEHIANCRLELAEDEEILAMIIEIENE